jgi:hypothetical protein
MVFKLSQTEKTSIFRLFFFERDNFVRVLLRRRIKDASPQLRLTVFQLLGPEVESRERMDSRAAPQRIGKVRQEGR